MPKQDEFQHPLLIYKLTNQINGKAYVGQTRQALAARMRQHRYGSAGSPSLIHLAILKYGWDNFSVEVLDRARDLDELNELEIYYIGHYRTFHPTYGYNLTRGGGLTKAKLREIVQNRSLYKLPLVEYLESVRGSAARGRTIVETLLSIRRDQEYRAIKGESWLDEQLSDQPEWSWGSDI